MRLNFTKRILAILLLTVLATQLFSCIQPKHGLGMPPDTQTQVGTEEESTVTVGTVLPLWQSAQASADAFFEVEGIVDHSKKEYSYYEMVDDLAELGRTYPTHFSYRSIGKSVVGRDIYVAVLGNENAPRQILVSAGIHGREYLTPLLVMKQLEFYLAYYDTGECNGVAYSTLFEKYCFYVVPMTNPDGIMLSQQGISSVSSHALYSEIYNIYSADLSRGLTKAKTVNEYLESWKANVRGVDLNRNFDALWDEYKKGMSAPSHRNYKGSAAASEPETRAMVELTESLSNVQAVLCIHSQGEVLYWDCGQGEELAAKTRDFTTMIADRAGYYIVDEQNNDASFSDWCALEKGLIAVTVETGNGTCPLPISDFTEIWKDHYDLLPLSALYFE